MGEGGKAAGSVMCILARSPGQLASVTKIMVFLNKLMPLHTQLALDTTDVRL